MAVFIIAAGVLFLWWLICDDFEDFWPGFFIVSIVAFVIWMAITEEDRTDQDNKPKTEQTCKDGTVVESGKLICHDNKVDDDVVAPKEEAPPPPPKEETPPEDKKGFDLSQLKGEERTKVFQRFADDIKNESLVSCDASGNQIYVSVWLQNDGLPANYSVWPRLRADGRPYRCEGAKEEPVEEKPAEKPVEKVRY